jgi:hypothetical protein
VTFGWTLTDWLQALMWMALIVPLAFVLGRWAMRNYLWKMHLPYDDPRRRTKGRREAGGVF